MANRPQPPRTLAGGSLFPNPAPAGRTGDPVNWPDILRRPDDFAAGPPADRWFAEIADALLNRAVLVVNGVPHRLMETEVYYYGPGHEDVFSHQCLIQLHLGRWYFHRTRGSYRGGSFKGLDLAFGGPVGDAKAFGGVLLRGLETPDGVTIDGPSLLVDHLLKTTGFPTVAALDAAICERVAWDATSPVSLAAVEPTERPILRTARVGLLLKYRKPKPADPALAFVLRRYRFLTEPRRTRKGKPQMVLALHADGVPAAEISARTGCPPGAVKRAIEAFAAGAAAGDPTPFYGKGWTAAEFAAFHGVLWGARKSD